jgi:uncharacterized protein YraI
MTRTRWITTGLLLLILSLFTGGATLADGGAYWLGEYFSNAFFVSPTTMTRTDTQIAFDWGAGSPGLGLTADNFSVKWSTTVMLTEGVYRFWAAADDGIRVVINNDPRSLIDTMSNPQPGRVVSGDVPLRFGPHQITVFYREDRGDAYAFLEWANLSTAPGAQPSFTIPRSGGVEPGGSSPWFAQYYSNPNLAGEPSALLTEPSPSHNWGGNAPLANLGADYFSVRFTSQQMLGAGVYRLSVRADDGVRVYVNGALRIDQWQSATGQTYNADVNLTVGSNLFVVEFMEIGGDAFLDYSLVPLGSLPPTPAPTAGAAPGQWLAYYFNNTDLTSTPAAILSEVSPSHNWGQGSPLANINRDNFSARWTLVQSYPAGFYRLTVRADDGVRVYLDGVLVINQWQNATGQTYTYDTNLTAGPHTLVVEYYEASGDAFLEYNFARATPATPAPTVPPVPNVVEQPRETGARAVVGQYTVNIREQPSTDANIIVRANPGESFSIMGRLPDSTWWQVNYNGLLGWVFGNFVSTFNTGAVPITFRPNAPQVINTGYLVTATADLIIRATPGTRGAVLGNLRAGQTAPLVGRSRNGNWWQINLNGVVGWVTTSGSQLPSGADINRVPITG